MSVSLCFRKPTSYAAVRASGFRRWQPVGRRRPWLTLLSFRAASIALSGQAECENRVRRDHRDVLSAVELIGERTRSDTELGCVLEQLLARSGIESVEVALIAALKYDVATCDEVPGASDVRS